MLLRFELNRGYMKYPQQRYSLTSGQMLVFTAVYTLVGITHPPLDEQNATGFRTGLVNARGVRSMYVGDDMGELRVDVNWF